LDVVRAEAAVSEATLNLQVARNNASTARVSLALLMGIDPRTPIEVAESEEPAPPAEDLESLVQLAIAQRPELGQAEATRAAAIHALDAARSTDAPTVAATAGVAARGVSTPPLNHFLSVGIQVQWSPFDGGVKDGRVQEAQASIQAAEAQLEGTRRTIIADVSQAYLNLRTAEQRVVTADAGIANAEEALRLATGRYNAGLGTFLDVLDAQAALLTARTQRVNAEVAVAQARAALARAIGTPLDEE
ncbi:MAG TPA: TolC family protein, partial [Armatimonadota bacterium]|nr:TolC family protein [Armatimonadota bacterium]